MFDFEFDGFLDCNMEWERLGGLLIKLVFEWYIVLIVFVDFILLFFL